MKTLSKTEALQFLPPHRNGEYNPSKYLLGGFVGSKREVLLHLLSQAIKHNVAARTKAEQERLAKNVVPLNRTASPSNKPKLFQQLPRDLSVMIPNLRKYGDAWLVFTNCKLNGGFYKNIPGITTQPEMISFTSALRQIQPRILP